MRGWLLTLGLLCAIGASAQDVNVLALRDGTYVRIASWERRGEFVVLTDLDGALYRVPTEKVDFALSKEMSEKLTKQERERARERAQREQLEARERRIAELRNRELTLLEASLLYGVDNPAISVASRAPVSATDGDGSATAPSAVGGSGEVPQTAEVQQARARLSAEQGRLEQIDSRLAELRANRNPNPLVAAKRQSTIERWEQEQKLQQQRVDTARSALQEAEEAAVEAQQQQ